ncbi:hypothetical protein LAT59_02870 [Candidatus Gracilibacteria bacterium]|nr:hypothetical protein [Candidatus Gracilibacteria bacterium]
MKTIFKVFLVSVVACASLSPVHANNNMTPTQVGNQVQNVQAAANATERGFIGNIIANIFNTSGRIQSSFIDAFTGLQNMNIPYWNDGSFVPGVINQTAGINGRIGIGTSPHSSARVLVDGSLRVNDGAIMGNPHLNLLSGTGTGTVRISGSDLISLRTNNLNRLTIRNDGNIGIGTTSPSQMLDVAGKIRMRTSVDDDDAGDTVITKAYLEGVLENYDFDDIGGAAPIGSVMAFNRDTCPAGWITADGQNDTPDLRGEFIRGLDLGRGVDPGRTLGSFQLDELREHSHDYLRTNTTTSSHGDRHPMVPHPSNTVSATTSVTGGDETRPRNVALLYCIKMASIESTPAENFTWINNTGDETGNVLLATSGNVGIGTNNPQARLHVSGKILAQSPSSSDGPNTVVTKGYLENQIPTCAGTNQALGWNGTNWICNTIVGGGGTPEFDLVFGLHSSQQCENLGGEVVLDSDDNKFCRFAGNSCPSGWTQYQNWQRSGPNSCSGECTSCTTATSGWLNSSTRPTCTYRDRYNLIGYSVCGSNGGARSCTAQINQIGCY